MKKSRLKRVLRVVVVLVVLLAILVGIAPWLAGTAPVRNWVEGKIGKVLGREVRLGELSAGWTSGVRIRRLAVANGGPEFGDAHLLEIADVSVEDSLTDLITRGMPTRVRVRGLKLNVEEQAGGRTNLDDLLEKFAKPRPVEKPPPPKKALPIRVTLEDCAFRFTRLAHRPPGRAVDPFEEDAPVRAADEGTYVLAMKDFKVDVDTGENARVTFDGGIDLNGKPGHLSGDLALGDEIKGSVVARGLDLALADPFVAGTLAGSLDIEAEGGPRGVTVKARVTKLRTEGEGLPSLDEAWVDVRVVAERGTDAVTVKELACTTASGAVELTGSGAVPTGDAEMAAPFELKGRFPLRLAFEPTGDVPADGTVTLAVKGAHKGEGTNVEGSVTLAKLAFRDPQLGVDARDIRADFRVAVDRAAMRAEIDHLKAESDHLAVNLSGATTLGEPLVCDLKGAARADLERLHRLLRPFLPLDPNARVKGTADVERLAVARDAAGNTTLRADATVTGFAATGLFEEDLETDRAVLAIDASLEEDGDVLRVRTGRLNDLTVEGDVAGLKDGTIRRADGSVKGSLDLNPILARLAGRRDITTLGGRVTLDLKTSTDKLGVQVGGEVTLADFRVAGAFGTARHTRAVLKGTATGDEQGLKVSATLAATGVDVAGSFGRVQRAAVEANAQLERAGVVWHGKAALASGDVRVLTPTSPLFATDHSVPTTVEVAVDDLARLRRDLSGLELPPELEVGGPATLRVTVARKNGRWRAYGQLESKGLTARWDGAGPRGESLILRFDAAEAEDGYAVTVPGLQLRGSGTVLKLERGFVGADQSFRGDVDVTASLAKLKDLLPQAEPYRAAGRATFVGTVAHGAATTVTGKLELDGLRATIDGRRASADRVVADLDATRADGMVELRTCRIEIDGSTVNASGRLGDRATLKLVAKGDASALARFLPEGGGKGALSLDVDVDVPIDGDGPLRAKGTFRAAQVSMFGARLDGARGEFDASGKKAGANYTDLQTALHVRADRAAMRSARLDKVEINQNGHGALRADGGGPGFAFQAQVNAARAQVETIPIETASLTVRGNVKDVLMERREALALNGSLGFARASIRDIVATEGSAQVRFQDQVAHITDLRALVNGGTTKGEGTVDLSKSPLKWTGKLEADKVRLTESVGRPLSFLVPILRVTGGRADRRLSGTLSTNLDFSGSGTTMDVLQHSLSGSGHVSFHDVEIVGSLLLPLLSLRIDRLLSGKPYSFGNLDVGFRVAGGRVRPTPFTIRSNVFSIKVSGDAGLDGSLNFRMLPSLLPLPLKVTGHIDRPRVRPTTPKLFD